MKAKARFGVAFQPLPMTANRFEQVERAGDIGLDKGGRPVDRTIDMAFRGQVHDDLNVVIAQKRRHQRPVGNVALDEAIIGVALDLAQRSEVARIGQLVEVHDLVAFAD